MCDHTTLRLGGEVRFFVSIASVPELREALVFAQDKKIPFVVVGGGSNVLFVDDEWNGLVIHMKLMGREYEEGNKGDAKVTVAAGEIWDQFVEETVSLGYWGIENLSRIPGTVGAAPVQNIGAYGVEVAEVIDWVEVLNAKTNELHILSSSECRFGYRDSIFKHEEGKDYIITRVSFRFTTQPQPRLEYKDLYEYFGVRTDVSVTEVREAINKIREAKFPSLMKVGTAGSFFKNPIVSEQLIVEMEKWLDTPIPHYTLKDGTVKIPAGWILERLGWKGKREGNVGCWEKHALLLVHYGEGSAKEFLNFVEKVKKSVKEKTTIILEPEVRIVGAEVTTST